MMKTISLLAALLGALFFAVPAFAETNEARPGEMVTLTFRLAVDGDVPGWQHFAVEYYPAGGSSGQAPLCTTAADEGTAGPMCVGGNSYKASVKVPAGNPVTFRFVRSDSRTAPEYFKEATKSYAADTAVGARYDFPGAAPEPKPNSTPAAEPEDTGEVASDAQYGSDDADTTSQVIDPTRGISTAAPDPTVSSVPASVETTTQSATPTASSSTSASASASASASPTASASTSASASASADAPSPAMKMLPNTGGIGALPILGLVLVLLGAVSAFRKAL